MRLRSALVGSAAAGAAVALAAAYFGRLREWQLGWGATEAERAAALPGDEIVPRPDSLDTTRAIDIDAPPAEVWPWIVQLGFGRAGWYSYDLLDHLGRPSARQVLPEHQTLAVGDLVPGAPAEGIRVAGRFLIPPEAGFRVGLIDPGRHLVLTSRGWGDYAHGEPTSSWAFVLRPRPGGGTRLIERIRAGDGGGLFRLPGRLFWELADFVMMRRQLLGIRERAEDAGGLGSGTAAAGGES